ncbi:MAG TPA: hypothetical protein VL992_06300, partial [Tepidisphaeraceae bacterium]|nr:hypothetical protein [Tepidisphaeraceae bacterium]
FDLTTMTGGESKFAGAVSVASLQVGIGPADINTSTITTSGAQNYAGAVTLSSSSTLSSTGGGAITFGSTLDGPFSLTVATAGTATFDGAVGGAAQLAGLTVTAGPSVFDAGVTLNGPLATAATQFNGTVNATAVSTGAATLDGGNVVTTGAQTYGGPVTVGADVVLNSGGGATTFDSTLSGPYIVTLTGSGLTTFNGGVNVGQLRVQGPTDINTASITTGATQTYIGPVTLSSDTTIASSGGENITFNSTVNGPYSLAVNTAGQTDFDGAVGGLTPGPLASLSVNSGFEVFAESVTTTGRLTADVVTFDGPVTAQSVIVAGANLNGGTITTTEGQSYGAVTLGAATVLTDNGGVGIDLHSTVTGPSSLTINSPATTEIDFPVNVKSLTINSPSLIGADITTSRTQLYNGAFAAYGTPTLTSTGTGSAADITFSSKVSGTQLTTASDGTTTFNGAVGTLTSLTTEGNSSPSAGTVVLDGGSVITDGAQNYQNAVVLGTGTTINSNGGQVTFGSTVDGNSYLNVYNSPTATFDGAVGGTTPLAQLDVSGLSTFQSTVAVTGVFLTGGTALNGDVRAGSVQIDGPSTINASSITSIGNEGPDGGGVYFFGPIVITDNTTLNGSNGYVTLGAGSVTARSGLWNLSVQSGQGITDNDDMTGLNNVSLIAGSVTSSTPSSAITVRGNIDGIAGNVSFTAPGGANTIDFNPTTSTSISISALGNVTFNRTSPLENNQYATIIGIAGTPNLVISLPGPPQLPTRQINLSIEGANVTFDQGEKLTAVGNVTIDALGGTAVLGDISAQGAIDVSADTINILERAPANLPTGVSDGTDYVGDSIAFNAGSINAIPVAGHTYLAPIFATPSITNISSSLATSGFIVEAYTSLPSLSDTNLFFGPTLNSPYLIDLQAEGNSIVDPATAIAGAVPRVIPQPLEDVATNPFQVKGLEAYLGITTTSPTYGDLIGFLQGAALYNDVPEGASTGTVTVNRLSSRAVADVLASFDNLFFAPVLGPDGRPVLDSRGVPQRRYLQSHIRDVFIAAQRSFIADEGAGKFTPLAFGDYILATPSQQEAADDLLKLQKLFTSMQQLGLSSAEFARSRDYILGEVAPPGMSPAQFYQTIMGQ